MSEFKNKKVPSERSEEVLLIHCTSPTTGSPTDREVILSHAAAMRKEERRMRAKNEGEQSEWVLSVEWTVADAWVKRTLHSFRNIHEQSEWVNSEEWTVPYLWVKTNAFVWVKRTPLFQNVIHEQGEWNELVSKANDAQNKVHTQKQSKQVNSPLNQKSPYFLKKIIHHEIPLYFYFIRTCILCLQ